MTWFERWRGLHFDPPGHLGWLFALLAVAAVAYAAVLYRRTDAPLGAGLRALLAGLRAAALLVLLGILCRPVVSLAVASGAAKGVVVLLDRSQSMSLPGRDASETRETEETRAAAAVGKELSGFPVSVRPFSLTVGDAEDKDHPLPPADGPGTDLSAALEGGLAQGGPGGRPGALVLVTDGAATRGPDPVAVARRLGVPVQTVALGSPSPVPDLAVTRVRANREAFTGERSPVDAVLRLQGLAAATVRVKLLDVTDGESELAAADARLQPDGAEVHVPLSFTPNKAGLRFLEVRAAGLPGEATAADNRRMVAITVREEKTGVVLLTGSLTWDHTFLRRSLEVDSTLAVSAGVYRDGSFQRVPGAHPVPALTSAGLHDQRLVVLDHVTPGQLGVPGMKAVAAFVRAGGGMFMVTGSEPGSLRGWRGTPIEELLPVQALNGGTTDEVQPRLTAAGRRHVLFDSAVPGAPALDAWSDLPPVPVAPEVGPVKGNGEALLVADQGAAPRAILSWIRAGQGRTLLFTAGNLWKWDFTAADHGAAAPAMPGWWRRAAHWLARPDIETRVDIHPEDYVVPRGKPVTFTARITDESYRPVADAKAEITVTPAAGSGAEPRTLELGGEGGILSGVVDGLPSGRYRYEGRASSGNRSLGTVDGSFAVDSLGTEMERLEADHELLARLAEASGGKSWGPDSLGGMNESFRAIERSEEARVQVALWDSPFAFAIFVLLASTEWLLRRRRGLV